MKEEILRAIEDLEKIKKYYSPTNNHPFHWGFNYQESKSFDMAVASLQEQLDRVEGIEWEKESDYYNCSNCKNSFDMDEDNLFEFCPRCGRKLKNESEE